MLHFSSSNTWCLILTKKQPTWIQTKLIKENNLLTKPTETVMELTQKHAQDWNNEKTI